MEKEKNNEQLNSIIRKMEQDIFGSDSKLPNNKAFKDIIEITYAYEDFSVNKTLFKKLTNINNVSDYNEWYLIVFETLEEKRNLISKYINQLQIESKTNGKIRIIINYLEYIDKIIELTQIWLPFELEKSGYKHNLTKEQIIYSVEKMEQIETELFGGNVRDNSWEISQSVFILENYLKKNKENLTTKEQKEFENYINQAKKLPKFDKTLTKPKEFEEFEWWIMDKEISREDYTNIFKLVFNIYNIQRPIIVDSRSSIYDGEDALYIPNNEAYNTLKIKKILQLISHEIETHYIIQENSKITMWETKWAWNLTREEGTAKVLEWILVNKKLEDFNITISLAEILLGEILDPKDFDNFLQLYRKAKWFNKNVAYNKYKARLNRRKRLYPMNYKGVQHKDTSYARGQVEVVNFIKSGGDVKSLYYGKVWFQDLDTLKNNLTINPKDLKYPILIWEIILQYIDTGWVNHKKLLETIQKKYNFIDFSKENTKRLTFFQKRKLVEIFRLLEK